MITDATEDTQDHDQGHLCSGSVGVTTDAVEDQDHILLIQVTHESTIVGIDDHVPDAGVLIHQEVIGLTHPRGAAEPVLILRLLPVIPLIILPVILPIILLVMNLLSNTMLVSLRHDIHVLQHVFLLLLNTTLVFIRPAVHLLVIHLLSNTMAVPLLHDIHADLLHPASAIHAPAGVLPKRLLSFKLGALVTLKTPSHAL
jgi:hypothetical protein